MTKKLTDVPGYVKATVDPKHMLERDLRANHLSVLFLDENDEVIYASEDQGEHDFGVADVFSNYVPETVRVFFDSPEQSGADRCTRVVVTYDLAKKASA